MKIPGCILLFFLLFAAPIPASAQSSASQPDYSGIGRQTVTLLSQQKWLTVEAQFDPRMKAALPQDKLVAAWNQLIAQAGAFRKIENITVVQKDAYHVVVVTCAFANASMDVRVTVDSAGNIAGLFFVPASQGSVPTQSSASQPDYSAIGQQIVTLLSQQKWLTVEAQFDPRMQAALSQEKLVAAWNQLTTRADSFEKIENVKVTQQGSYHVALVTCAFTHAAVGVRVAADSEGRIAGLFFVPAS